ncbi:sensor histidine kinase [Xanthomarina sp.]|uniref:sensor histidine kinase n=1 Tax=Xanthomarina sp. TaxID=1931211 RepID=UPI002C5CE85F|nr:sensor histidine kinase [Xanthomarina sp.]HLV40510.1 sensor histidine kinase [Xanthomarina sp.]
MDYRIKLIAGFFYCFLFTNNFLLAQNVQLDSLNKIIQDPKVSQGEKIFTLGRISHHLYFQGNSGKERAQKLLDSTLLLAKRQKDGQYKAFILSIKAFNERIDNNIDKANYNLQEALKALQETDNQAIHGYVYYCKGWMESRNDMSSKSISTFLKALEYLENETQRMAMITRASIYSELSNIYSVWQDYENQGKYVRKFYSETKKSGDKVGYVKAQQQLASFFEENYRVKPHAKVLLDSAFYYNKQAVKLFLKNDDQMSIRSQLPFTCLNIANLYSEFYPEKFEDSASYYLDIALEKGLETEQYTVVANVYGIKSEVAQKQNDLGLAIKHLLKAEEYADNQTMFDYATKAQVAGALAKVYELQEDYINALLYYKKYLDYYQKRFDNEKMAIGKELEAKYESEKKEQRLGFLEQQVLQKQKLNFIYILLTISAFLTLFFLFLAYRQRSKNLAKQQQVHQLELEAIKKEHRISLLSAMIDGQENERTRLARDLHDGMGGLLSGIKIELSGATALQNSDKVQNLLQQALGRLDHAMDELRRIARSMMPSILLQYGLAEAMREYCNSLSSEKTKIICQIINYKNTLPESKQIIIYRIFQELLNNALKHAQATQVLVQFQQQGTNFFLTVEDDGEGYNMNDINLKKGSGLVNIEARVAFLKGRLEVNSQKDQGTTIQVEFNN